MIIIKTKPTKTKSKQQRNAEWLAKVNARIAKRKEKEATRKRPKKPVTYTLDDLSPELKAKMGLNNLNTPDQIPPATNADLPQDTN